MTQRAAATEGAEAYWREIESGYAASAIHGVLGLTLEVVGAGEVRVSYDGAAAAGNRSHNVAGGALAAMIDSAATQSVRTLLAPGDRVVTVDLNVSFVRPGHVGERLSAVGHAVHVGGSLGIARATASRENGEVVAMGMATIAIRRADKDRK